MKRFHSLTAIFAGFFILILFLPFQPTLRFTLLCIVSFLYLVLIIYGVIRIDSQLFLPASCKGDKAGGKLAITFDDGPDGERSLAILELLRKYECHASFFLVGSRAEKAPDLVKLMRKDGHHIGNHSYSHSSFFPLYSRARIRREVDRTTRILEEAGSGRIRFFRPPFGVSNPNVAGGLKGTGLEVAGWSIRSFDTRNGPAEKVVGRIVKRMGGGDVILLHETSGHILEILEQLLPAIHAAGLSCITMEEMFESRSRL